MVTKISKEKFNELIKKAVNCLVRGIETRYRLENGTIVVNYGGMYYKEGATQWQI